MNDQDLALIEEYVKGDMTADEKAAFEARLKSDPDLSSALSDRQKMEAYLTHRTSAAFTLDDLREMNQQNFSKKQKKTPLIPLKTLVGIAASVLLIFSAYFLYITYSSPSTPEELYQAYAEPIPLDLSTRSGRTCINDQSIIELYAAGNYTEALPLIRSCLAENPDNSLLKMAQGFCLMEMEETEEAQKIYEELLAGETLLKEEAAWNLALNYIKADSLRKAINVLEEQLSLDRGVDQPVSKKYSREKKLMKDLRKLLPKE